MNTRPDIASAASQLTHSLARLAATATGYAGTQLERMDDAIRAERRRWIWAIFGAGTALLLLGVTAMFAGLAVVLAFWESNPVLASTLVAVTCLVLAAIAGALLWRCALRPPTTADRIVRMLALFLESRRLNR